MSGPVDVHDVCETVRAQVLALLDECERPPITRTYSSVGVVAWDDCCGMLVVTPDRVYRSSEFPNEDTESETCTPSLIAVDLTVALVRCVPGPTARGEAPPQDQVAAAFASIMRDAAVVWRAVGVEPLPDEWERARITQEFDGEQGTCVAVLTRVTVGLPGYDWCYECPEPDPEPEVNE